MAIDLVAFVLGAVVGSFANVCIYRLPRGESLLWPPSHCPSCGAAVRWYDNIPLLSFAALGARCRDCRAAIGWRYPLVEVLLGVLFVQAVATFGIDLRAAQVVVLETLLVIVFFVDLDQRIIPNRVTYPGILVGLLFAAAWGWQAVLWAAVTAAVLGALFVAITVGSAAILGQEGMGLGDAKLAAMIGAFLGWPLGALAIFLGVLIGGIIGIALLGLRLKGRRDYVPFGPALSGGAFAAVWWGPAVLHWYVSLIAG